MRYLLALAIGVLSIGQALGQMTPYALNLQGQYGKAGIYLNNTLEGGTPITADQIFQWTVCATDCPGTVPIDGIRAVVGAPNNGTQLISSLAGYALNDNSNSGALGQSVAVQSVGISSANNAKTWGFASILSDSRFQNISAGTGRYLYNEFDFNITSPNTQGSGLQIGGTWLVQPSPGVNGFAVNTPWGGDRSSPSAPFAQWGAGLVTQNGCCQNGVTLGTAQYTVAPSKGSQPLLFNYFDASGSTQNYFIHANTSRQLEIDATATNEVYLPGTLILTTVKVGSAAGVTCSGVPSASFAVTAGIVTHC